MTEIYDKKEESGAIQKSVNITVSSKIDGSEFKGRNQDRTEFKVVGQRNIPGRQSYGLATGLAKFNRDIVLPDMLHAKALRSPYAHARITKMDISRAQALPGVATVVTYDDPEIKTVPPLTWCAALFGKLHALTNEAEREGDEIGAIVVAESEDLCDQALNLIKVEWEQLPFVLDPSETVRPDAPVLLPKGEEIYEPGSFGGLVDPVVQENNVYGTLRWEDGNVAAGLAEADQVIEYDFAYPHECTFHPVPITTVAYWEDDPMGTEGKTLVIDNPEHIVGGGPKSVAVSALNLPMDKVHVLTAHWGGKYCAFVSERAEALAPLLAKRTGRPVRMAFTRRDEFDTFGPNCQAHVKIGFKNDGTLTAADGQIVADVGTRGAFIAAFETPEMNCFRSTKCPNIKQDLKYVYTNTGRSATPGSVGCHELLSKAFYVIADKLGMDPTEVALLNCHTPKPSLKLCIDKGREAIGWQWHPAGTKRLANGKMHGYGFRYHWTLGHGMVRYTASISIQKDGKVYMPYEEALIGTYWHDCVAMVIAEELGAKLEDVIVYFVANMSGTPGSAYERASSCTWVAKEAAIELKATLLESAALTIGVKPEDLDTRDSTVYLKADPSKSYPFKQFSNHLMRTTSASYSGKPPLWDFNYKNITTMNAVFCEVEVDTATGEVEITNWVAAVDSGKVIRPTSWEGQIEQYLMYSTGLGKFTEMIFDKATGVKLNASTLEFKGPTILDLPPINIIDCETRTAAGSYGSSGVSHSILERAIVYLAVYNAIGKWIDPPITPDKVLKALGKI